MKRCSQPLYSDNLSVVAIALMWQGEVAVVLSTRVNGNGARAVNQLEHATMSKSEAVKY
jgi:hypothetical protein